MQGKQINVNFVNEFIIQCVNENKTSPQEVCQEAKQQIIKINNELNAINQLKISKNSLLDVLSTFNENKPSKRKDREQLPFFNIKMKTTAHSLCLILTTHSLIIKELPTTLRVMVEELERLEIVKNTKGLVGPGRLFDLFVFHFMRNHYGL